MNKKRSNSLHNLKTSDNFSDKTSKILQLNENNILKNSNKKSNSTTIIKIDLNVMKKNDYEYNTLQYKEALILDKRTYFEYYLSLLKINHVLLFPFRKNDYNSFIIKIYLFLFSFILYYAINTLFFSDSTMHKIYEDEGSFNFVYQIPITLYSFLISNTINYLLKYLSLSEKAILNLKNCKIKKIRKYKRQLKKCLFIKYIIFFIISFILLLLFWYYISCFCVVFKNTQILLIKDTLISYGFSLLYPFGINLLPGFFRIRSLKSVKKDKKWLYRISKYLQSI